MVLYLIGLGLHDPKDISIKGLEVVKEADEVYLEGYTSSLYATKEELERFYGRPILPADRTCVEQTLPKEILPRAKEKVIALLVIGDPLAATTHMSLRLDAHEKGIPVKVIHNASVLTAIGVTGLELYKFGKVTSIPFENTDVTAPIDAYKLNQDAGLHTLFLLDLMPDEDRFMRVAEAAAYLIRMGIDPDKTAIACAGLGDDEPELCTTSLKQMQDKQPEKIPQCLILPGRLHFLEEESIELWRR